MEPLLPPAAPPTEGETNPPRQGAGEGEELGRTDAAVTRSQKRKRDEEEALVERKTSGASAETVEGTNRATSSSRSVIQQPVASAFDL